jgi:tRNA threonylcarbamoyladenosine biosynthesis protein TsaB
VGGRVIILGIDTATAQVSVAVGGHEGVLASTQSVRGKQHAEVLTPAIEFTCKQARVELSEISVVAVDLGPGLFTGLRVGVAAAKAMAHALQVPVVGVSSLDLLAYPMRHASKVIASVIDARKGEVFYAFFLPTPGGVQRVSEPRACSIEDFNADVMARGQDVLAVGDGAHRYREELEFGIEVADLAHPLAASLVILARARALRSDFDADGRGADAVQPMYLRAPDAQINWSTR